MFSLGSYHKQHLLFIYNEVIVLNLLKVKVCLECSETSYNVFIPPVLEFSTSFKSPP